MFNTLCHIAKGLNHEGVIWAVGGSVLLNHYGLIDNPNDIDIIVSEMDVEKADYILGSLGEKKVKEKIDIYSTKTFYSYAIDRVEVDMMSGFIINHTTGKYEYTFDNQSISTKKLVNDIEIPMTSLEDWYILYQLMPNRDYKVQLIEDYIRKAGVRNKELMTRALAQSLPNKVKSRIENILHKE